MFDFRLRKMGRLLAERGGFYSFPVSEFPRRSLAYCASVKLRKPYWRKLFVQGTRAVLQKRNLPVEFLARTAGDTQTWPSVPAETHAANECDGVHFQTAGYFGDRDPGLVDIHSSDRGFPL